jgi:hypothetical protein
VASVLVRNIETQRRGQGAQKAQQAEARAQQAEARAEGLQRQLAEAQEAATEAVRTMVSQNGWLLSRRGRSLPANASGFDTHRDSISSLFDCRQRPTPRPRCERLGQPPAAALWSPFAMLCNISAAAC